jgi:hypothetical protein
MGDPELKQNAIWLVFSVVMAENCSSPGDSDDLESTYEYISLQLINTRNLVEQGLSWEADSC